MKTSFLGLFSAAVCILTTLVAASPVVVDTRDVVALDARDATALDTRDITIEASITIAISAIDDCNNHYISYCGQHVCSQNDFVRWSAEITVIVRGCVDTINGYTGTYTTQEHDTYHDLVAQVFIHINVGIWYMANHCNLGGHGGGLLGGLVGGLLANILNLVFDLLNGLLYDLTYILWELLGCLNLDFTELIGGLEWGTECCLCNLPVVH